MFTIKQYNTLPSLEATLVDYLGLPVNLTGSTVAFAMRSKDNPSLVITGVAALADAPLGKVSYQWGPANTNTPGGYIAEFIVTYPGGGTESFPNGDYIEVHVVKSAANPS